RGRQRRFLLSNVPVARVVNPDSAECRAFCPMTPRPDTRATHRTTSNRAAATRTVFISRKKEGPADLHLPSLLLVIELIDRSTVAYATGGRTRGTIRLIKNSTRNTKNSTCAILLAVPAIPPKPKTAAINAITKKVRAQLNMLHLPFSKAEVG